MPDEETGVAVPLLECPFVVPFSADFFLLSSLVASAVIPFVVSLTSTAASPFFRFLLPGAFFSECVRPDSLNLAILSASFAISSFASGTIGMISVSLYASLHSTQTSPFTSRIAASENACPHGTRYTLLVLGPSSLLVTGHTHFSLLSSFSTVNLTSTTSLNPLTLPCSTSSFSFSTVAGVSGSLGRSCSMIASLLYSVPAQSDTIGVLRGRFDRGHHVQA